MIAAHENAQALENARIEYQKKARDNARTPVQWSAQPNGGFSSVKPWMKANPLYTTVNAESQISDPNSTFNYWTSILALRKAYKEVLVYGDFKMFDWDNEKVMAYTREAAREEESNPRKVLVLCNWTSATINWESKVGEIKEVLLDNYGRESTRFSGVNWVLRPYEACVVLLDY